MFDMRCEEEAAVLPHSRARQEQLQLINNQLKEEDDKWQDVSSGQSRGQLRRDSADHRAGRVDFKALLGRAAPALQTETSLPGIKGGVCRNAERGGTGPGVYVSAATLDQSLVTKRKGGRQATRISTELCCLLIFRT